MEKRCPLNARSRCTEWNRAEADPGGNIHMGGFLFDPTWARTLLAKLGGVRGALAALTLMVLASISPSHAQAPPLGTLANFSILANTGITNPGPTVITGTPANPGDLGTVTATIGGFPPGIVNPPGIIHMPGDAPTILAQISHDRHNNLVGRTTTVDLTGQDLGGKTLVPGVYNFSSLAQLTGTLALNGLGNLNSPSSSTLKHLTTASASAVSLINGAQGGNVF